LAMLRAPAFISQRWKSATGSLGRAGRPLPAWPLPLLDWLGWSLLFLGCPVLDRPLLDGPLLDGPLLDGPPLDGPPLLGW